MDQFPSQTPDGVSADPASPEPVPKQRYTLRFERFSAFVEEYASLLSLGGMFLKTESLCDVGTHVGIDVKLTDGYRLFQGSGEVVWVRPQTVAPGRESGMAVRFQALDESGRELILKILEEQVKGGGEPFDVDEIPADLGPPQSGTTAAVSSVAEPSADPRSTWPVAMGGAGELSEEATLVTQRKQLGLGASQGLEFSAPWGENLATEVPADVLQVAPRADDPSAGPAPLEESRAADPQTAFRLVDDVAAPAAGGTELESPFAMETTDFDELDDLPELDAEDDLVLESDAEVRFDRTMAGPPPAGDPKGDRAVDLGEDDEPTVVGSLTSQGAEVLLSAPGASANQPGPADQGGATEAGVLADPGAFSGHGTLSEDGALSEDGVLSELGSPSSLDGHAVSFDDPAPPQVGAAGAAEASLPSMQPPTFEPPASPEPASHTAAGDFDLESVAPGLPALPEMSEMGGGATDSSSEGGMATAPWTIPADGPAAAPPLGSFDGAEADDPFATHEPTAWPAAGSFASAEPAESPALSYPEADSPLDSTEHLEAPEPPVAAPLVSADLGFGDPMTGGATSPDLPAASEGAFPEGEDYDLQDYDLEAAPAGGWRGALGRNRILLASLLLVAILATVFTLRQPIAQWLGFGGDDVSRTLAQLEEQPPTRRPVAADAGPSEGTISDDAISVDAGPDDAASGDVMSDDPRQDAGTGATAVGSVGDDPTPRFDPGATPGPSSALPTEGTADRLSPAGGDAAAAASQVLAIDVRPGPGGTEVVVEMDGTLDASQVLFDELGYNPLRQQIRLLGIELPFRQGTVAVGSGELTQIRTGLHGTGGDSELRLVFDMAREGATASDYRVRGSRLQITVR